MCACVVATQNGALATVVMFILRRVTSVHNLYTDPGFADSAILISQRQQNLRHDMTRHDLTARTYVRT